MATSTITSKGQITIPATVWTALGISTGDRVEFVQVESWRFELLAATLPVSALKGMVKKPSKRVTIEETNEAIASTGQRPGDLPRYECIGLLVRYITQDDPIQSEQANALLESLSTGLESYVTVVSWWSWFGSCLAAMVQVKLK